MDEFFQKLREIQKKERSISGLSRVGDNFYTEVSDYLNKLMRKIDNNPFSFESYLLRDAQRIVAEICERREHKIANSAVMNVQRAYQLFKESKAKNSKDDYQITVPMNSTPEEEGLYLELVDSIIKYREKLTSPLMSYIQKNHGNENKAPINRNGEDRSLKSINIDDLLADAQDEMIRPLEDDRVSEDRDFDDQIYENYGSEPARKDGAKKSTKKADEKLESGLEELKSEKSDNTEVLTLMILDELPSIVGVDKNVYGPVYPQDLITIPEPNAKILVKNKKGILIQTYK